MMDAPPVGGARRGGDHCADRAEQERQMAALDPVKGRQALQRYRVMAWVTGTMLLILCLEVILRHAVRVDADMVAWISWVPFAHGWIYVVYLAVVMDLWSKMRWSFGRLAAMVLAGVVPVMSFVLERRVHADAVVRLEAAPAR
jgi:integral membrane protein